MTSGLSSQRCTAAKPAFEVPHGSCKPDSIRKRLRRESVPKEHSRHLPPIEGEALWFGGYGKWRGCAATVHDLIRGDLLDKRSAVMGAGLRPRSKGLDRPPDPIAAPVTGAGLRPRSKDLDWPPDPKATQAARRGAALGVIEQKSAEGIVGILPRRGRMPKARTR